MLSLDDAELEVVTTAAAPLSPIDRDAFPRAVADELAAYPPERIGVGLVGPGPAALERERTTGSAPDCP
jgi:hypothetical protein